MITPEKIDEWIHEVEERPTSAPNIIRYIANRLRELAVRNEDLLDDNIALRSGRKVEEYESRISNLEYQVDLLKRQLGGEVWTEAPHAQKETLNLSLLFFNAGGQILRVEIDPLELASRANLGNFTDEWPAGSHPPGLLVCSPREELLFVFDSGRTEALPVTEIPVVQRTSLDWRTAYLQEPRGTEALAVVLPVAKMSLYDFCIQTSGRGFIKKIKESFFETHIANNYVGTGVTLPLDRTCSLDLCNKDDLYLMVSKDGFLVTLEVNRLPFTITEALRLGPTDYIVTTMIASNQPLPGSQPSYLFITNNGKAVHRAASWLEPAASFRTQGQLVLSKDKRAAGVRIVGAAGVEETDWCVALSSDGKFTAYQAGDLFATGTLAGIEPATQILAFTTFRVETPQAPSAGSRA